ncbi:MAG: alanine/ornithine racemase family PLP-dependent enzyme [Desulfobacterium sp.]|jgi:predicted amino acid racemase|nr:alanine/ornithine racemase family PLP-dependent enzyme [Desulfobacterium sp.]
MTSFDEIEKKTPRVEIDLKKIHGNTKRLKSFFDQKGISMMCVTKGVLGSPPIARAMVEAGVKLLADSRIENLKRIRDAGIGASLALIRTPSMGKIKDVVKYADISVNSEISVIERLSLEARDQNKIHGIILMVDLGDLREGILPRDLEQTLLKIMPLTGVKILGIGTNLGCIGGILPDQAKMDQLSSIAKDLEQRFNIHFNIVSGGNSANYNWVKSTDKIGRINNLRIGEMILTGRETVGYARVEFLETDTISLVAQVIEVKEKESLPRGTMTTDAFGNTPSFVDRGTITRAIVEIGRQDVLISGLTPMGDMEVLGASSDHIVMDLKKMNLQVGDEIRFHMDYGALLSAMTSPYIQKVYLNKNRWI